MQVSLNKHSHVHFQKEVSFQKILGLSYSKDSVFNLMKNQLLSLLQFNLLKKQKRMIRMMMMKKKRKKLILKDKKDKKAMKEHKVWIPCKLIMETMTNKELMLLEHKKILQFSTNLAISILNVLIKML